MLRVVSLIASATEMVCALGCQALLVGRSHECDYPPQVTGLVQLTEPKFMVDGTSAEIDGRVKELLRHALSVYRVRPELLEAARPDVIITQSQCEVCAVSLRDVEEALCQVLPSRPRVISLMPNTLDDVWRDLRAVAEALAVPARGEALCQELQGRMAAISRRTQALKERPRVAFIEWLDPLMAAGNWMPTLCAMAGGTSLFGEEGRHSPWLRWEALVAADPEVLILQPCGFDIRRTMSELSLLTDRPGWPGLRAVQGGRVFVVDGNQYFNRPGPRLVESLEILAELFHPDCPDLQFGHEGSGWIRA